MASTVLIVFVVYFQAYVLAAFQTPWLHVDLISIVIVFTAIEHFLGSALLRILFAAVLMQTFSWVPSNFYLMYFLIALVFANLVSRLVVLYSVFVQFLTFAGIFLIKFVLLYLVFHFSNQVEDPWLFFERAVPSFVVTTICAVPVFWFLTTFDSMFEVHRAQDRSTVDPIF